MPHFYYFMDAYCIGSFMDWLLARIKKYPSLHVYHYGAYEVAALKRLTQKYKIRLVVREHER